MIFTRWPFTNKYHSIFYTNKITWLIQIPSNISRRPIKTKNLEKKKWKSRSLNLSLLCFVFAVGKHSTNSLLWGSTHDHTQKECFTNWAKVAFACVSKFSISRHHNRTPKNTTTTTPPQTTTKKTTTPTPLPQKQHDTTKRHHHKHTTPRPTHRHKNTKKTPQFSTIVSPPENYNCEGFSWEKALSSKHGHLCWSFCWSARLS